MDPEAPKTLGDLEESEPERRAPTRSNPVKRTLEDFLLAFEERLREHPDQAATSATAALEGRADGSWRTPIDGGERSSRRLPRRVVGRRPEDQSPPPSPAIEHPGESAAPVPLPVMGVEAAGSTSPAPGSVPAEVLAGAESPAAVTDVAPGLVSPEPGAAEPDAGAKRRNRHRRRHRHR